eukprot:g45706.t1
MNIEEVDLTMKLFNSMLIPEGRKVPRWKMKYCSSSLHGVSLEYWSKPIDRNFDMGNTTGVGGLGGVDCSGKQLKVHGHFRAEVLDKAAT